MVPAYNVEVWDVLPTQENCTEVSAIVPASGRCDSAANAIEWPPSAIAEIGVGANTTLSYILQIRPDAAAGETFTNTAGVRSYVGEHNASGQPTNTYFPLSNIDPTVTVGAENAPAANGTANVITAIGAVTKSQVTSITNTGNTNVAGHDRRDDHLHRHGDGPAQHDVLHGVAGGSPRGPTRTTSPGVDR